MLGTVIASLIAFGVAVLYFREFEKRKKLAATAAENEARNAAAIEDLQGRLRDETLAVGESQRRVAEEIKRRETEVARMRAHYDAEAAKLQQRAARESEERWAKAAQLQQMMEQEVKRLQSEAERVRVHYETEALKVHQAAEQEQKGLEARLESLKRFEFAADAEAQAKETLAKALKEAEELSKAATLMLETAKADAKKEVDYAKRETQQTRLELAAALAQARRDAEIIRENAEKHAIGVAGESYQASKNKAEIERALVAIRNLVDGYGDRYVIPSHGLLQELAEHFGYEAGGQSMLAAQAESRRMVEDGEAAECEYADEDRRATAVRFVLDAFNGRVDAALSRVRVDNVGTLEQEIRDAFALVNMNGAAFRNARIKPMYLDARLAELKWAAVLQELRVKEREEQRKIREKIREEEKARREYERAMRDAAREEEILKKAMAGAQKRAETASEEQKAKFETQLRELSERLKEAEEKNQRAISMAQQTKRGHVYVISNVGSLGEDVYKIGLTRRLEPMDRIWELGDASVPFDFDVHAMIFSEDAPALETKLHKQFLAGQVNKVNHRREFFRVSLKEIRESLEKDGVSASWTMSAAAAEYRETLAIEKLIAADPEARRRWLDRQLELDPVDYLQAGDSEESPRMAGMKRDVDFERVERSLAGEGEKVGI